MSYEIIFLDPASEDLEDAFSWYESKRKDLGLELVIEIETYLELIKNNPYLFEEHKDKSNLHRVPLVRFPYLILYWIVEKEKIVYIDAVFHSKRKPKFE